MRSEFFLVAVLFSALCAATEVRTGAKTLYMKDTDVASISIALGRSTILNFPTKPSKVVLGNKNHFAVEYIESDIAISALHPQANCNLIVYLQGRRFSFDLTTGSSSANEILLIRDGYLKPKENVWKSKQKSPTRK